MVDKGVLSKDVQTGGRKRSRWPERLL